MGLDGKKLSSGFANNKGADQPVHLWSETSKTSFLALRPKLYVEMLIVTLLLSNQNNDNLPILNPLPTG